VRLVGLGPLLGRPLARVLDGQRGGDDHHLARDVAPARLHDHPGQPGVHRQQGEGPPDVGQPGHAAGLRLEGVQLGEQLDAVAHGTHVRRVDEREARDVVGGRRDAHRDHLQDHRGQRGAQDLRLGELRPGLVVRARVQPDRDAVGDPAAPACALVRRRLADRLDRQPLHLGRLGPARDPGGAGVDDVPHARHGQRGLRDVGGQDDAAGGVPGEHPVLLGRRQPRVQRQQLDGTRVARIGDARPEVAAQGVLGVADLPLAGEEHQDVAGPLGTQLVDRLADGGHHVPVLGAGAAFAPSSGAFRSRMGSSGAFRARIAPLCG